MADLLPDEVVQALRTRWGERFDALDLATAAMESTVSHSSLLELCDAHSHDVSVLLARLVRQGMLVSDGRARGTVYYLAALRGLRRRMCSVDHCSRQRALHQRLATRTRCRGACLWGGSEHSELSSEHSQLSSAYSQTRQDLRDAEGRLLSPLLDGPVLDDLGALAPGFLAQLQALAAPARSGRLGMDQMQAVNCAVCEGHYVTRTVLARLLDRSPDALRQTHISPMVRSGMLELAFPSKPTHEQQA